MRLHFVLVCGMVLGCGDPTVGPDGQPDSGIAPDVGHPDAGKIDAGVPDAGPPDAGPTPIIVTLLYDYDASYSQGNGACNGTYHQELGHCTQTKTLTTADLKRLTATFSTCSFSGGPATYTVDCSAKCQTTGPYQEVCYDWNGKPTGVAVWYGYSCSEWRGTSGYLCEWWF